jgi:hypothetical protein
LGEKYNLTSFFFKKIFPEKPAIYVPTNIEKICIENI